MRVQFRGGCGRHARNRSLAGENGSCQDTIAARVTRLGRLTIITFRPQSPHDDAVARCDGPCRQTHRQDSGGLHSGLPRARQAPRRAVTGVTLGIGSKLWKVAPGGKPQGRGRNSMLQRLGDRAERQGGQEAQRPHQHDRTENQDSERGGIAGQRPRGRWPASLGCESPRQG